MPGPVSVRVRLGCRQLDMQLGPEEQLGGHQDRGTSDQIIRSVEQREYNLAPGELRGEIQETWSEM